nr:calcium and integrin-binding protein 1 isoform X1 [Chelonoidis abingdonii]
MGGSASQLPRDLLGEYQELTFLSKQEILLAHKRFSELLSKEERESILQKRVPKSQILTLPELRANPFRDRICRVFSTSEDGDGSMSFEDFLDMLSVFSDSATSEIKSHYAFRIFDFDDDGTLDRKDLEKLVNCLTGEGDETRLSESEMDQLIQNFLQDCAVMALRPFQQRRPVAGCAYDLSVPSLLCGSAPSLSSVWILPLLANRCNNIGDSSIVLGGRCLGALLP